MIPTKEIKKSVADELAMLIKQKNHNKKIQKIIETHAKEDLIDSHGRGLIHLAAQYNNIPLIEFLIKTGKCELDIEDSSGMTPIMIAATHDNLKAARILHFKYWNILADRLSLRQLDIDIDTYHTLRYRDSINAIVPKMREKGIRAERIGGFLAMIDCPLSLVVLLDDPAVTRAYLQPKYRGDPYLDIPDDMFKFNVDHIQVLVKRGLGSNLRIKKIIDTIMKNILIYQKSKEGRDFLKKLLRWEIWKESSLKQFEKMLKKEKRQNIRIFLQYGFHTAAKDKCGQDILAGLYANRNPKVITLLKDEEIDVNNRYHSDDTPLHYAAEKHVKKNVQLLLDKGADPNSFNRLRKTPLYLALQSHDAGYSAEIVKLLLLGGANPLIVNYQFREPIFEDEYPQLGMKNVRIVKLLSAQFAIYEAQGLSIEKTMELFVRYSNEEVEQFFGECRQQLKELKAHKIRELKNGQLSLFEILAEKPEKIARYIRDEDLQEVSAYVKANRKKLYFYYREVLRKHTRDIAEMNSKRSKAIAMICKYTGIQDLQHLVIQKIFSYLSVKDLLKIE